MASPQCYYCNSPVGDSARFCPSCSQPLLLQGKYRILRLLGQGGFGAVYEVVDQRLGRRHAVKAITSMLQGQQRQIEAEAGILAQYGSQHSFIPDIYDIWSEKAQTFLVMEYVEGTPLDQTSVPWPAPQVEEFLRTTLDHLATIHDVGIVHRDLKPANIIRTPQGRYVFIDFGIAKQTTQATLTAAKAGTPGYAPPEQIAGQPTDARTDLYSLGGTAYYLLTGRRPAPAEDRLSGSATLVLPGRLAAGVPDALDAIIVQLLELEPERRPSHARMALQLLDRPDAGQVRAPVGSSSSPAVGPLPAPYGQQPPQPQSDPYGQQAPPPGPDPRSDPTIVAAPARPRRPLALFVGGAGLLLALLALAFLVLRDPPGGAGQDPGPVAGADATATAAPTSGGGAATPAATAEPATPAPAGGSSGPLRIHQAEFPVTLDPHRASRDSELAVVSLLYEGLTRLDEELRPVGGAAESWQFSSDGRSLTFRLREGLTYSDGSPLSAADFRAAMLRTLAPEADASNAYLLYAIVGAPELSGLPDDASAEARRQAEANLGIVAVDDLTLEIRLEHPSQYILSVMSMPVVYPLKQEIAARADGWSLDATQHIGNGPFILSALETNTAIDFVPNARYHGQQPRVTTLRYLYVPDPANALALYEAGELEIMRADPAQVAGLEQASPLAGELRIVPAAATWRLTFHLNRPPFDDLKVRQAFSLALDRERWCEEVWQKVCFPWQAPMPDGLLGSYREERLGFDVEQARQLLAESRYAGALPAITLTYPDYEVERAEWMAVVLREGLGVDVELKAMNFETLFEQLRSEATHPQLLLMAWVGDYADPQNWLSAPWACWSDFASAVGYCNDAFDDLINEADGQLDWARREQLYREAGPLLVDDMPAVFLSTAARAYLVKPLVTGYTPTLMDAGWPGSTAGQLTIGVGP